MAGAARRHPLCQDPWHQASALAHGIVGAAPFVSDAAIALANKIARMAWAMRAKGIEYDHVVQALSADRANEGGRKPCAKISVGAGGCSRRKR